MHIAEVRGTRFAKVIVVEKHEPQKLLKWSILSQYSVKKEESLDLSKLGRRRKITLKGTG